MIMTGGQSVEALWHLLKPHAVLSDAFGGRVDVVVIHDGRRYGGFRDEAHAGFFVRAQGLEGARIAYIPWEEGRNG